MKPVTILATIAIVLVSGCGDAASSDGTWRFKSLHVDGEQVPIEQPLFLDISNDGFRASTTCNTVSGDFGADIMTTLGLCGGEDAMTTERYMSQAFENEPTRDGDQLVFDDDSVRLVYEAFTDPQPAELFAVLGDPSLSVDESQLPPENVTGSVPPDFESLVPLPSPSNDVDLFLGTIDGNVCIVYGTHDAMDTWCDPTRLATVRSQAVDIPIYGSPIVRVALIPDRFATSAAARPDLGTYEANILTVRDDAPAGQHDLTDDAGDTLQLVVPSR